MGSAPLSLLSSSSAKKDMQIKVISTTDDGLNVMIKRRQTQSGDNGIWDFGVWYVADRENDSKANDVSKQAGIRRMHLKRQLRMQIPAQYK